MSNWDEPGWYERGALIRGLYAMEEACLRARDALAELKASTDYITEHYRNRDDDEDQ